MCAAGHGNEQEDEEAFLESITNPAASQLPGLACKVKMANSDIWSSAVLIKPGQSESGQSLLFLKAVHSLHLSHLHARLAQQTQLVMYWSNQASKPL